MDNPDLNSVIGVMCQYVGEAGASERLLVLTDLPSEPLLDGLQCGGKAAGAAQAVALSEVAADPGILGNSRWQVVYVVLPELEKSTLVQLLASLRDLHARRVIHIDWGRGWSLTDSLALGFSSVVQSAGQSSGQSAGDSHKVLQVYEFNKHNYKPAPDWLNARHWAHPELWGKHRW